MDSISGVQSNLAEMGREELEDAVRQGNSVKLMLAIMVAIMVDVLSAFAQFLIFLGPVVLIVLPMIWAFFAGVLTLIFIDIGGHIKWKVRGLIYLGSFLEWIPFVGFFPFYTLCTMYAIRLVKKHQREAEEVLEGGGQY